MTALSVRNEAGRSEALRGPPQARPVDIRHQYEHQLEVIQLA